MTLLAFVFDDLPLDRLWAVAIDVVSHRRPESAFLQPLPPPAPHKRGSSTGLSRAALGVGGYGPSGGGLSAQNPH